jgi:hypothetical protein
MLKPEVVGAASSIFWRYSYQIMFLITLLRLNFHLREDLSLLPMEKTDAYPLRLFLNCCPPGPQSSNRCHKPHPQNAVNLSSVFRRVLVVLTLSVVVPGLTRLQCQGNLQRGNDGRGLCRTVHLGKNRRQRGGETSGDLTSRGAKTGLFASIHSASWGVRGE